MDVERFGMLVVNGHVFCINAKALTRLTENGAHSQRECSRRPLRRLQLKNPMNLLFARSPGELEYTQKLDKLYQDLLSGHPPVFGMAYCYFAV